MLFFMKPINRGVARVTPFQTDKIGKKIKKNSEENGENSEEKVR